MSCGIPRGIRADPLCIGLVSRQGAAVQGAGERILSLGSMSSAMTSGQNV
jgi:hypothetical protein